MKLTIIVPAKNEASNLANLFHRIDRSMTGSSLDYQVILVDDYSTDDTYQKAQDLSLKYPIIVHSKQGPPGKAYAILEAINLVRTQYVAMLDADLQYPPEAIPDMLQIASKHGVVLAQRKFFHASPIRRLVSRIGSFITSNLVLKESLDVQTGLKIFRKEIAQQVSPKDVRPWSLDLPLLYTAKNMGFSIGSVNIKFNSRHNGQSKVRLLTTTIDILSTALKLKLRPSRPYIIAPQSPGTMIHAGVIHQQKRYVTHTDLHHNHSAMSTFTTKQVFIIFLCLFVFVSGLLSNLLLTLQVALALLNIIYFSDVLFNLFLTTKSLLHPPEIKSSSKELAALLDNQLPKYSILCPLYKESHVLEHFVQNMSLLDWPKDKLDVILLLEENDPETIAVADRLQLPKWVRVIIVPESKPKTKPKACNYGLQFAKGEYVVIYDAEDQPAPDQLKKAFLAFQKLPSNVFCLQAKLNYYNPNQNLLTRLFTAEYSLWFDLTLPGLQTANTIIPLGGTSNHFKTKQLLELKAWDPFNVTEDCDLGARIFKLGFRTAIIDSTTLEEANSNLRNWIRQRSRWIKGYLQTFFVHNRSFTSFFLQHGRHALLFQLIIGLRISFMLINPILWVTTISYFVFRSAIGEKIEALFPGPLLYLAVFTLIFGNFIYLYNYMIATAKRGQWDIIKYVFLVPLYWLATSYAALVAVYQLITKPHYWEKTHHGLHLNQSLPQNEISSNVPTQLKLMLTKSSVFKRGSLLVVASMFANFVNYLYNAYLGRRLGIEEYGLVSVIWGILNLVQIPFAGFTRTLSQKVAFLFGKDPHQASIYWQYWRHKALPLVFSFTFLWIVLSPFTAKFFNTQDLFPFLIISPIWLLIVIVGIDSGIILAHHRFEVIALATTVEVVTKFVVSLVIVESGLHSLIYLALPLSVLMSVIVVYLFASRVSKQTESLPATSSPSFSYSKRFLVSSILSRISSIAFLNLDVVMAKHYLDPISAGHYALLSLAGKMVYFLGSLFTQFITPIISREDGSGKSSRKSFSLIMSLSAISSLLGVIVFGIYGYVTIPLLLGDKAITIVPFLPMYTIAMSCLVMAGGFVTYHQVKNKHLFSFTSIIFALIMLLGISIFHTSIFEVSLVLVSSSIAYLATTLTLNQIYPLLKYINFPQNLSQNLPDSNSSSKLTLDILIFNWRDIKHVWAGGAEVYLHELAKSWVQSGHRVTLITSHDRRSPRHEEIDGIKIIRKGGFYSVYFWSILTYIFKTKKHFDVIIDSSNGVPFFTPLFVKKPIVLIIHHVNQDTIFGRYLRFPLSGIAKFVEKKVTPFLYRNRQIVTVSESSKSHIISLGINAEDIQVINPGVNHKPKDIKTKSLYPSFIYLGRLKPYKNVDVLLKAFSKFNSLHPKSTLTIAGDGESRGQLEELARKLGIDASVIFSGKVPESSKHALYSKHWAAIQPSSIEGWGITVIEANAASTPVIASDVSGLKDSVIDRETGMLVPAKNETALLKAMLLLSSNLSLRNQLSQKALEWSRKFSWDSASRAFIFVLFQQISKKNKSYMISSSTLAYD